MDKLLKNKGWAAELLTAMAASLCCITPVLVLLEHIRWSTSTFLRQTLDICEYQKLSIYKLSELSDIYAELDLSTAINKGLVLNHLHK